MAETCCNLKEIVDAKIVALCEENKDKEIRVFFSRYFTKSSQKEIEDWCIGTIENTPSTHLLRNHCFLGSFILAMTPELKNLATTSPAMIASLVNTPWQHLHETIMMYLGGGDQRKKEHGFMLWLKPLTTHPPQLIEQSCL